MEENDRVAGVMTNVLTTFMENLGVDRYINAGVIIINLKARRTHTISRQIIDFIVQYPQ